MFLFRIKDISSATQLGEKSDIIATTAPDGIFAFFKILSYSKILINKYAYEYDFSFHMKAVLSFNFLIFFIKSSIIIKIETFKSNI